jgi:hypothetical protein
MIITIAKDIEVEVWDHKGEVFLSIENGDDRARVFMSAEMAEKIEKALREARQAASDT